MDLELSLSADDELAPAHRRDVLHERISVEVIPEQEEFGAVQVLAVVPIVDRDDWRSGAMSEDTSAMTTGCRAPPRRTPR